MHHLTCHWVVTEDAEGHRHLTEQWADWTAQKTVVTEIAPVVTVPAAAPSEHPAAVERGTTERGAVA